MIRLLEMLAAIGRLTVLPLSPGTLQTAEFPGDFAPATLSFEERERVLKQAKLVLEHHYVHLSQKIELYKVEPLQALDDLLDDIRRGNDKISETQFSRRLVDLLRSMRDRHLDYVIPYTREKRVAYLPFQLARITENGEGKYIVSRIVESTQVEEHLEGLERGVQIVFWNGAPILDALLEHADRQPGCSPEARLALALRTLPMRALQYDGPPDEGEVTIGYVTRAGVQGQRKLRWRLALADKLKLREVEQEDEQDQDQVKVQARVQVQTEDRYVVDARLDLVNDVLRAIFAPVVHGSALGMDAGSPPFDPIQTSKDPEELEWLRARYYSNGGLPFGYIRILKFPTDPTACWAIEEFARVFGLFQENNPQPTRGLVIDIRDCPGGGIQVADYVLQMVSPSSVKPLRIQPRNTPANLRYCSLDNPDDRFGLKRWVPATEDGDVTTDEGGVTKPEFLPALCTPRFDRCSDTPRRQTYLRPVVLITSALTYSAADFFAAGFQDHDVGPILGVHPTTGGGGANVVNHDDWLIELGGEYEKLPAHTSITFPLLRARRRGRNEGKILEDYAVRIDKDHVHERTRDDIDHDDTDLIRKAASLIGL